MRMPAAGVQVYFNIADAGRSIAELNDCTAKIRTTLAAEKTRMKHTHVLAVQGFQLMTMHALVLPNRLKQFFWRHGFAFAQNPDTAALQPPLCVKTCGIPGHLALLLLGWRGKVKPPVADIFERVGGLK